MTEEDIKDIKEILLGIYICLVIIMCTLLYPIIGWYTILVFFAVGMVAIVQSK